MKKKTKKYITWGIIVLIIAFFLALPGIVNTKVIIPFKSSNLSLNGNSGYYTSNDQSCENDPCMRSSCLNPEDLPEEIRNYKICFCCINFEFKESKNNGEQTWKVKDYKIKMFYQEKGKELEKPFFTSNPSTEFPIPNLNRRYISLVTEYSKPYYYTEKYPDELQFNFHRIRVSYRKLLEFITAQG